MLVLPLGCEINNTTIFFAVDSSMSPTTEFEDLWKVESFEITDK